MILSVYSYKDNALGCFTNPFYDDRPIEHVAEGVKRAIVKSTNKEQMKYKVLYKIGEFDDSTGIMNPMAHELIVDCDSVLAAIGAK